MRVFVLSVAAVCTLIAVIGWLGAIDIRDTFSASAVSSAAGPGASTDRRAIRSFLEAEKGASGASVLVNKGVSATPAATGKRVVKTSVTRVGGKSYLRVQVTSGYGGTRRFSVKQRVCVKKKCRTVTAALSVSAGRTAWHETYLGTDTYKKSGGSSVSVTTPKPARTTPAPRVTVTVRSTAPAVTTTVTVTETVTTTVTATVTATATATVTATVTPTPTPTPTPTLFPTPTPFPTPSVTVTGPLCGAPPNPYGFTFCETGRKINPPADFNACLVFQCIENFPNGTGYLVMCKDGKVSMSGGLSGVCSSHGGWQRDVNRNTA
ncbi:hypothetical protein [Streptosporangium sp. NPDC048865]|uniref:hypothetical protein n=1 Tax=Streptosporangium sp. NPDC048865 TaxID=3155766 RepID=UPI0034158E7E